MTRKLAVVVMLCGLWALLHTGDDYNLIRAHRFDSPRAWEFWLDRLGTMRVEPQVAGGPTAPSGTSRTRVGLSGCDLDCRIDAG